MRITPITAILALATSVVATRRVLFLTTDELGQAGIHIATSQVLAESYQDVDVHVASFSGLKEIIESVSARVINQTSSDHGITFHTMQGRSPISTIEVTINKTFQDLLHSPGYQAGLDFPKVAAHYALPYNIDAYHKIYESIVKIIHDVDPILILIDTMLAPGVCAAQELDRDYVLFTPNAIKDVIMPQLGLEGLYKYPCVGTAHSFPVPLSDVLQNIFVNICMLWSVARGPRLTELRQGLRDRGIKNPVTFIDVYQRATFVDDHKRQTPVLVSQLMEAEYPMPIPAHVTLVGPIYKSTASVSVVDPQLATWLAHKPTVLINLGSHIKYTEEQTVAFVQALAHLLQHRNVQVLWKYRPFGTVPETAFEPIARHIADGTIRLEKWFVPDPAAILETGNVVLFVHHGGANSFNEGLGSGVPAVVVPFWWDCYDFAVRAEWLGIGIWGTRKSAPGVDGAELGQALIRATGDGAEATKMREKVRVFKDIVKERGEGRRVAAREIVNFMDRLEEEKKKQEQYDLRDEL